MQKSNPSFILYLDIDGVLCPYFDPDKKHEVDDSRYTIFNENCLAQLRSAIRLCQRHANIEVALCSSWRKNVEDIISIFEQWPDLFLYRVKDKFCTSTVTKSNYDFYSNRVFKSRDNKHLFDSEIEENKDHFADRGIEVQDHFEMLKRTKYDGYFIVDDEPSGYYSFQKPFLVSPNMYEGFSDLDKENLITKVQSKIKELNS